MRVIKTLVINMPASVKCDWVGGAILKFILFTDDLLWNYVSYV